MVILKLIISSLERMAICPDFLIGNQLDGFQSIGNIQQQSDLEGQVGDLKWSCGWVVMSILRN